MRLAIVAALAAAAILAGPASAQYYPYGGYTNLNAPTLGVQPPRQPQYQPYQAPQTWTGMNLGGGISTWNGSRGGSFNCVNLGYITTCN